MMGLAFRRTIAVVGLLFVAAVLFTSTYYQSTWRIPPILDLAPDHGAVARPVVLRGMIDGDMYTQVLTALFNGTRHFSIDHSPGGSPVFASWIAQAINSRDGTLTVTGTCHSACALALIGVKNKYYTPGADIGIHAASYKYLTPGLDPDQPARDTVAYLMANGLPADLARKWGSSVTIHHLTPRELALAGVLLRYDVGL